MAKIAFIGDAPGPRKFTPEQKAVRDAAKKKHDDGVKRAKALNDACPIVQGRKAARAAMVNGRQPAAKAEAKVDTKPSAPPGVGTKVSREG